MRMAETRAVNRALRKAYGIGLCSIEEIGASRVPTDRAPKPDTVTAPTTPKGTNGNGQPRLRDRLCQLIRQHGLDPSAVKQYALEFCGTASLREASRERVQALVEELSKRAANDREALLCQLNGYSQTPTTKEANP